MHKEAHDWVARYRSDKPVSVLDIGGRDVNGTVRSLFPNASVYRVLDVNDGPNVDVVADAAVWAPDREYDIVLSAETFEHTPYWPQICKTAYQACRAGGRLILTMAGPGRPEHSAIDGGWVLHVGEDGSPEYYGNVNPGELYRVLVDCGWRQVHVDSQFQPADTRATAVK